MSADTAVYNMSEANSDVTNIFAKKDWLSITDQQNGVYTSNQITIDTSQLQGSSNVYTFYREGYFAVPLITTMTSSVVVGAISGILPNTAATSCDMALGLKNWFGSIFHSFSVEIGGQGLVQTTPYSNMYNAFKLMCTLSYNDVLIQGSSIGFYPDHAPATSFQSTFPINTDGLGTCNNQNANIAPIVTGELFSQGSFNEGFYRRQLAINFNSNALSGGSSSVAFSSLLTKANLAAMYKSHIYNTVNCADGVAGVFQRADMAIIYLKHIHDLFAKLPLHKPSYMKMIINLNQPTVTATLSAANTFTNVAVLSPLGGVSPIMIASQRASNGGYGAFSTFATTAPTITISMAVGNRCLNPTQLAIAGVVNSSLASQVTLNLPRYNFANGMEMAYISSPTHSIEYEDIYQYNINGVTAGSQVNTQVTNGIVNIKRVLVLPFYTATANAGISPYQSPFSADGSATTSPYTLLNNFNVLISGQQMLNSDARYTYNHFVEQFASVHSLSGRLLDGMATGLVGKHDYEASYCYHLVDCSRANEIERYAPKSVLIRGQNVCAKDVDLFVFCVYGRQIVIDVVTGSVQFSSI